MSVQEVKLRSCKKRWGWKLDLAMKYIYFRSGLNQVLKLLKLKDNSRLFFFIMRIFWVRFLSFILVLFYTNLFCWFPSSLMSLSSFGHNCRSISSTVSSSYCFEGVKLFFRSDQVFCALLIGLDELSCFYRKVVILWEECQKQMLNCSKGFFKRCICVNAL